MPGRWPAPFVQWAARFRWDLHLESPYRVRSRIIPRCRQGWAGWPHAAVGALFAVQAGNPRAAVCEADKINQEVFAISAAATRREVPEGSETRKMPGAALTILMAVMPLIF
jgi:hypothetical protein